MKIITIALTILLAAPLAFAELSPITKIKRLYTYDNKALIEIEDQHANAIGCSSPKSGRYVVLNFDTTSGKEMYSAALSAFMADSKISIGFAKCQKWGATTLPTAYRVELIK